MLKVGIIGFGGRASGMARKLAIYGIPYRVEAVCDPRADEIRASGDELVKDTRFYDTPDEMLDQAELDGVMVGTRCHLHTPMALKVASRKLPLFLEKPVAVTFEQVRQLHDAFRDYPAPVVVSFPLRLSNIALRVKEIVESGAIGSIEHVVAFNDVPYGATYYRRWYRNWEEAQGLFLQKATHDFDCIHFLLEQKPAVVCAMNAQRIYGGDKPFDLVCQECDEQEACPESALNLFHERSQGDAVKPDARYMCMFSRGIRNEDCGNAIVEYENGVQMSYSQNFFARQRSARRGARLYGYKGTIHFDWYENKIRILPHQRPGDETIDFGENFSHFGGDRGLVYDFLMAMKERRPSRAPIEAGILSALTCLCAKKSAETRQFVEVRM